MTENTIQLSTGQTARINEGRIEVVASPTHYYCLMVERKDSGGDHSSDLKALSGTYDELLSFLKQLEKLGYRLRALERMTGEIPPIRFAS